MTALSNQYCLPDGITPEIFLRDYWQKKPLIIRNGLPEIVGQFEPDDIIELAQGEDVTARLVKPFQMIIGKCFLVRYLKKILRMYPRNGRCLSKI